MKKITFLMAGLLFVFFISNCFAKTDAELAAESEAYTQTTTKTRPTPPSIIVEKVNKACELLHKEGPAAFPKFKGKGSDFLFEGTYIWIHTLDNATMLMHPIKYKMAGNKYINLKDKKGKRFFTVMNSLVKKNGEAWVDYLWPIPGTKTTVRKISFVKGCTMADGREVVLGCGLYNYSEEDIKTLDIK